MVNPTIQRRRLGNALRRAREVAGWTQDEAAEAIDSASSKISRLEQGQSGLRLTDLKALLELYNITGEEAETLREMARAGRQRGRWSGYRNVIPDWFRQYLDLEAEATEIRWYQPEVIPGILQTEAYVRAMLEGGREVDVDRQVEVREQRKAVLDHPDEPDVSLIVSESALRRTIGDPSIMYDQLDHLAKASRQPNVKIQVFPFDAQSYVPPSYPFTILNFSEEGSNAGVIYVESFTDADYLDRPDAVRSYTRLWDQLSAAALGPGESRSFIQRCADEFKQKT